MLVCSSINTTLLTHKRTDRPTEENDGVALSLERRDAETSPHKDRGGDSAPHKHAVAARPSTGPAGAAVHALFKRRARRPRHTSKRTHNKQPAAKK